MASPTTTRVFQSASTDLVVHPRKATPVTEAEKSARSKFVSDQIQNDEAKTNQPSKLDKVIVRQAKSRVWIGLVIADLVQERVECGQSRDEAIQAILDVYRERANAVLAQRDAEAAAKADNSAQPVAPIALVAHKAPKATKAAKASN